MKLAAAIAATGLLTCSASAQTAAEVQWEVIAVAPQQVIFFDARPDRIESSVQSATVFTFHVLKAPAKAPDGQSYSVYMQRTKFSCLKPEMSRELMTGMDDQWGRVFVNNAATPMVPFKLGTATADISAMACDHLNPTQHKTKFSNRDEAIAWAKQKLASG